MKYKIEENKNGLFTIYNIREYSTFFGKKTKQDRMYINHITTINGKRKWYINGMFTSEDECIEYLNILKELESRDKVSKIIEI